MGAPLSTKLFRLFYLINFDRPPIVYLVAEKLNNRGGDNQNEKVIMRGIVARAGEAEAVASKK